DAATAPSRRPGPPRPPLIDAPDRAVLGTDKTIPTASLFEQIRTTLGDAGTEADGVLTIRLPRTDLFVILDGNEVPAASGIRHELMFHRCPCGTMLAHGQFLLLDYEVN